MGFKHVVCKSWSYEESLYDMIAEVSFVKLPSNECMLLDLSDDKSTLVQEVAWCCQAASHYQSKCWPSSMLPQLSIIRPQWV